MSALAVWIEVQFVPLAPHLMCALNSSLRVLLVQPDASPAEVGNAVLDALHHSDPPDTSPTSPA
ncbi:MAG: hypothetical protein L0I76_34970 [Pseudonocardia sp.]|nr:hypothetical protein [Pseudonocardia sp.]